MNMTDGKKIIEVTEEEFEHLIKLRQELLRRQATGETLASISGGRKGVEFGMGAVAGFAAYYLYKELFEDEDEDEEEDEGEDDDGDRSAARTKARAKAGARPPARGE
jgi:hypothetical protein